MLEKDRKPAAVIISLEDYRKRFVDVEADRRRIEVVERIKQRIRSPGLLLGPNGLRSALDRRPPWSRAPTRVVRISAPTAKNHTLPRYRIFTDRIILRPR